ncbi:hypothetical protein C5167_031797 [Papaver somniferum]|uniref:Uncharacterized protein n=1 Tax=Papaver somniferum TaxID=3469 RepID=A0A4Y7K979_PAPSO|nr:hypothetical protein C5167_031797 [Papaver somniferum]
MYRASSSRLRGALKSYDRNRFAAYSSGTLFNCLAGENSKTLPPLNIPLPGIINSTPLPDFVRPSKTKMTMLPNGVRIASQASSALLNLLFRQHFTLFHLSCDIELGIVLVIGSCCIDWIVC